MLVRIAEAAADLRLDPTLFKNELKKAGIPILKKATGICCIDSADFDRAAKDIRAWKEDLWTATEAIGILKISMHCFHELEDAGLIKGIPCPWSGRYTLRYTQESLSEMLYRFDHVIEENCGRRPKNIAAQAIRLRNMFPGVKAYEE